MIYESSQNQSSPACKKSSIILVRALQNQSKEQQSIDGRVETTRSLCVERSLVSLRTLQERHMHLQLTFVDSTKRNFTCSEANILHFPDFLKTSDSSFFNSRPHTSTSNNEHKSANMGKSTVNWESQETWQRVCAAIIATGVKVTSSYSGYSPG